MTPHFKFCYHYYNSFELTESRLYFKSKSKNSVKIIHSENFFKSHFFLSFFTLSSKIQFQEYFFLKSELCYYNFLDIVLCFCMEQNFLCNLRSFFFFPKVIQKKINLLNCKLQFILPYWIFFNTHNLKVSITY